MIYHVDESASAGARSSRGITRTTTGPGKESTSRKPTTCRISTPPAGSFALRQLLRFLQEGQQRSLRTGYGSVDRDTPARATGIEVGEISAAGHLMTFRTRFSPAMDFVRGEFSADIARLSPIAVPGPRARTMEASHRRRLGEHLPCRRGSSPHGTERSRSSPSRMAGMWTSSPSYARLFCGPGGDVPRLDRRDSPCVRFFRRIDAHR